MAPTDRQVQGTDISLYLCVMLGTEPGVHELPISQGVGRERGLERFILAEPEPR